MNLYILQQYKFINSLYKNANNLDVLLNVEDFFDILNLYAYPNWIDCEVVEMNFYKYFVNIKLKSPYKKMPHPLGSQLLIKFGCDVKYIKTTETVQKTVKSAEDLEIDKGTGEPRPKLEEKPVWIIDIMIPTSHILNDKIYDLEDMQDKINKEKEEEGETSSIVSNEGGM